VDTNRLPFTEPSNPIHTIGTNGLLLDDTIQAYLSPWRGVSSWGQQFLDNVSRTIRMRTMLPYPPADVRMGTKLVFDANSALVALAQTAAKAPSDMYEEGVDISFLRRDRLNPYLALGSDADETPVEETQYLVIATKGGVEYELDQLSASPTTQTPLSRAGHGDLLVVLRSRRQEAAGGGLTLDWTAWQDSGFTIRAHTWRNLLRYPRCSVVTGWTTTAGTLVVSASGGPTFQTGYFMGTAAETSPTTVRQRPDVRGYFPARMRASATFYTKRQGGDTNDTVQVDLSTTNDVDSVLDVATYSAAVGETTWTRHDLAIANADVDTAKLSVASTHIALGEDDTSAHASISEIRLRLGQHTANQVTNGSFESDLTGWTTAAGGFTVETSSPLEGAKYIQGQANASNEVYRDHTVPAGFKHSASVASFGCRHPGPSVNGTATVTLECRAGATLVETKSCIIDLSALPNSTWYRGLVWVDVRHDVTSVRIRLIATRLSGTNNQVQFDDVDLEFHKYLDSREEAEFLFVPPSQPMPRNIGQWNHLHPTVPYPSVCWLDGTLQPVLGVEPEFEATTGAFVDCKFTGLVYEGVTVEHPAYEVRRGSGGNIRTRSNRTFGNFTSSQPFTVRVVYDCREQPGSLADFGLAGRMGATGWKLEWDSDNVRATLTGTDGTKTITVASPNAGRTWAAMAYDPVADLLWVFSPAGAASVSTSSGMGEISCTELIRLVVGAATDGGASMSGLIATHQMWAEVLTNTQLQSLVNTTDALSSYSMTTNGIASSGLAATVMGSDADGVILGYWSQGAVYNYVAAEETWGFSTGSRTNLLTTPDPNGSAGWTDSGLTSGLNSINGPNGGRNGVLLSGTNAQYRRTVVTLNASVGVVNVGFCARADVAHTVPVLLYSSAGVLKETLTVGLTTTWQRFNIAFEDWDGATSDAHIRFYPSNDGTTRSMHLAGPVFVDQNEDDAFGPIIDLNGGTTVYYALEGLGGQGPFSEQSLNEGEVEVEVITLNETPSATGITDIANGANDNDRRNLRTSGGTAVFDHYDGTGTAVTSETTSADWRTKRSIRGRWQTAGLLDAASAFAGVKMGTSVDYDRSAIWTPGSVVPDVMLIGDTGAFEGTVLRLVCRTREQILPRTEF
jgi:hypothetical protein